MIEIWSFKIPISPSSAGTTTSVTSSFIRNDCSGFTISILKPGIIKIFSKSGEEHYYVEDGIVEFKNNNLSVLTSSIFDIKDFDKDKISELLTQAEEYSKNSEITDQNKYLVDQKIDVLKTLN